MAIHHVSCCVVGGGPAGMMLGALLARQGVHTMVLEKHADFLRDFRGDTVHPSTLEVIAELGWIDDLLELPHTKMDRITLDTSGDAGQAPYELADFRRLPVRHPYIAFMPQWDFLDFLADKASHYPRFELRQSAPVTDLIIRNGRVRGVRADTLDGPIEVMADLVVGADGRHSTVRDRAGLTPAASSLPMEVLWLRLPRHAGERLTFSQPSPGGMLICIDRGEFWQVAYEVSAGRHSELEAAGIEAFRDIIAELEPTLRDRLDELDWAGVELLNVRVDRLLKWYRPGLLCIGDAAHAMSPAGGVGINLAIQDAVAAANILGPTFATGGPDERALRRVQRRRTLPTRLIQALQLTMDPQKLTDPSSSVHRIFRVLELIPPLRHLTGRFIGIGIRPEHVKPLSEARG